MSPARWLYAILRVETLSYFTVLVILPGSDQTGISISIIITTLVVWCSHNFENSMTATSCCGIKLNFLFPGTNICFIKESITLRSAKCSSLCSSDFCFSDSSNQPPNTSHFLLRVSSTPPLSLNRRPGVCVCALPAAEKETRYKKKTASSQPFTHLAVTPLWSLL